MTIILDQFTSFKQIKNIKIHIKKWKHPQNNNKKREEVIVARARIGHTNLTHAYIISKDSAPISDNGIVTLSIQHITINCQNTLKPAYISIIQHHYNKLSTKKTTAIYKFIYKTYKYKYIF